MVNLLMGDLFDPRLCMQIEQTSHEAYPPGASVAEVSVRQDIRMVSYLRFIR